MSPKSNNMKAVVYFIDNMSDHFSHTINRDGWDCPLGRAYNRARRGVIDGSNFDLYVKVAVLRGVRSNEYIWSTLQNHRQPWVSSGKAEVQRAGYQERSMDVGDLIIWENGKREVVSGMGFTTLVDPTATTDFECECVDDGDPYCPIPNPSCPQHGNMDA
jgi:hypothetical protein